MRNSECYDAKIEEIEAIKDTDIILPVLIPVSIYLQEADNLYKCCVTDKEELMKANLDWNKVEEIPVRSGALRESTAIWAAQRSAKRDAWKKQTGEIYDLRSVLLHEFRFAYRKNPDVLRCIKDIARSNAYPAMIQDLNDLAVLGKSNPHELFAINFNMDLLNDAVIIACESAGLMADKTFEENCNAAKKTRDKAFTFLKQIVDYVRTHGQYAFWQDKLRKQNYTSAYLRRLRIRRKQRKIKIKNAQKTAFVKAKPSDSSLN